MKIIQKIKIIIILSVAMLGLSVTPAMGLDAGGALTCGVNAAAGEDSCTAKPTSSLDTTIKDLINIFSVIVGTVAVIMIMVAGFRYVTSGGSAEQTKSARNTLVYAVVGLIIVALAQVIVRFVLHSF